MLKTCTVKLVGGNKYQRLLKEGIDTQNLKSGHVILNSGESVGAHETENKEEIIVILEGKAEIMCESSDSIHAESNSVVYIPPETVHDVRNIGTGKLRYVYVVSMIK